MSEVQTTAVSSGRAASSSAAAELLAAHPQLTAIVCTSDILALGALRHATQHGITVPDQLTITGFDGVPEAERAGLTTVWQPVLEKGKVAGELLLDRGDRIRPRRVTLPTELRIGRTSCAPRDAERWFSGL